MGSFFFSDLAPHVVNQKHIPRIDIRVLQVIAKTLKINSSKSKHKPLTMALRLRKEEKCLILKHATLLLSLYNYFNTSLSFLVHYLKKEKAM